MWGVSHGAVQFVTYEEMRSAFCKYKNKPVDSELVRLAFSLINLVWSYVTL